MKKLVAFGLILAVAGVLFAQSITDPNPETVGADSAMLSLREVSVDKFEREGSWYVHISPDDGTIAARLFEGSPAMKEPLKEDEGKEDEPRRRGRPPSSVRGCPSPWDTRSVRHPCGRR